MKNKIKYNYINVKISRPEQELFIMRGIPGAGKSTKAKEIVKEGSIHSTDALIEATGNYKGYFKKMVDSGDWSEHGRTHNQNFINAREDMLRGISPIVIDNTNIRPNEAKKYVKEALELGYSDENIKFIDIGNSGLSCEELCKRNTHGVGLETIKRMYNSYRSFKELTIENVMKSKGKNRTIKFASLVLDDKSKTKLLTKFVSKIPKDWKLFAHHMTINYGKGLSDELKSDLGEYKNIKATEIGLSEMAIAVKVEGYRSDNDIPHITLAVNVNEGGKPVMSNSITNWEKLENYILMIFFFFFSS